MKVLITGATGYIGSAVAEAGRAAGHEVSALSRSEEAEAQLRQRGFTTVTGDLRNTQLLESLADSFDAVIHAANTGGGDAGRVDTEATLALLQGLRNSGKPFVYTSGVWVLGAGDSDEAGRLNPPDLVAWRALLEETIRGAAGVRAIVLRPGIVYGRGGGIPGMIARGELPIIGDGTQRWPLVHVDDLADLYVRALQAPAGAVLNGTSGSLTMRDLALLAHASRGTAVPASLSLEDARARMGPFADALALDQRVSSRRTQEASGWRPQAPSLVEEFLIGSYAAA